MTALTDVFAQIHRSAAAITFYGGGAIITLPASLGVATSPFGKRREYQLVVAGFGVQE